MIDSKCRTCRTKIIVKSANTRYCGPCRKKSDLDNRREWKQNHKPLRIKKCKMCDNIFDGMNGRLTCDEKCRKKSWWIIRSIERREKSLIRKTEELKELKIKYAHLL